MPDTLVDHLNPRQRDAVLFGDGPLLVLAGAGSGKTRVLTHRLAHLVERRGIPPLEVLAFTFTNRAAREMRERIQRLIGSAPGLWVGTFHAICVRILRRHAEHVGRTPHFTIYDADDQRTLMRRCIRELGLSDRELRVQVVQAEISRAKNRLEGPAALEDGADAQHDFRARVARVYAAYENRLRDADAFDFDDLILRTIELFRAAPEVHRLYAERFRHVLVDEYQDTNHAQYVLITQLAAAHRNLAAVGDDDQSIYSWRGADIRNILEFEESYPDAAIIRLEQNYRSTRRILRVANHVVAPIRGRKPKTLWTENEEGERLRLWLLRDEEIEAETLADEITRATGGGDLAYQDCVILYRTHAQSRPLEGALRRRGVSYQIIGGVSFYERREVKDLLAYLRLVSSPRDDVGFLRIVNTPKRGIGQTTVERLRVWARERGLTLLEACGRAAEIDTLGNAARRRLGELAGLVAAMRERREEPVPQLVQAVIEATHYLDHLEEDDPLTAEGRAENLEQLAAAAAHYADVSGDPGLEGFLADVALVADLDEAAEPDENVVTLMTVHNAKGLEYELVLVAGLEQGLFPHISALEDEAELDEERRLFYVALTRARRQVVLASARSRLRFGRTEYQQVSQFVDELVGAAAAELEIVDQSGGETLWAGGDWSLGGGATRGGGVHRGAPYRGGAYGGATCGGATPASAARRGGGSRPAPARGPLRRRPGDGRPLGAPATGGDDDIDLDPSCVTDAADQVDLDPEEWTMVVGAPVMHAQFGRGRVVGQEGHGPDARLTVRFEGAVTKRVVARYLSLVED